MAKISYNKQGMDYHLVAGSVSNMPWSSTTISSSGTATLSSSVPRAYNVAMFGYGKSNNNFDFLYPTSELTGLNTGTNITLYACWESSTTLSVNGSSSKQFFFPGQRRVFNFTPADTRKFRFYVESGGEDVDLYVYKNSLTSIASTISSTLDVELTKGTTYYIHMVMYSIDTLYNGEYKDSALAPRASISLTQQYFITYNYNYSGAPSPAQQSLWPGTTVGNGNGADVNFVSNPTRTGYKFLGWYDSSTGGNKITDFIVTNDFTLYAHWERQYAITYSGSNSSQITYYKDKNASHTIIAKPSHFYEPPQYITTYEVVLNYNDGSTNSVKKTFKDSQTYSFKGWEKDGTNIIYNVGDTYSTNADLKLTAYWESTYSYESITMPTVSEYSRLGYKLLGWSTDKSAKTATYEPGKTYTFDRSMQLYAVWEPLGLVRIYTDKGWKYAQPFIYINDTDKWKQCMGYVYDGSEWKFGI